MMAGERQAGQLGDAPPGGQVPPGPLQRIDVPLPRGKAALGVIGCAHGGPDALS